MKKAIIAVPILSLMMIFIPYSYAATTSRIATDFLIEIGLNDLKKGNRDLAIHNFSKALMIEPENQQAMEELRKLGVEQGLYGGSKTSLSRVSELTEQVKRHNQQVFELEVENEKIKKYAEKIETERDSLYHNTISKSIEIDALNKEIEEVKSAVVSKDQFHQEKLKEIEQHYAEEKMRLLNEMAEKQDRINTDIVSEHEKNRIINMYRDVAERNVKQSRDFQDELARIDNDYRQLQQYSDVIRSNYVGTVQGVDNIVFGNRQEISKLKGEVIDSRIELMEKQGYADEYIQNIRTSLESINTHKEELKSRLQSLEKNQQPSNEYLSALRKAQESLDKIEKDINHLLNEKKEVVN